VEGTNLAGASVFGVAEAVESGDKPLTPNVLVGKSGS